MTLRQARIALIAFVALAAGVTYNALYLQDDPAGAGRVASDASATAAPHTTGQAGSRQRPGQGTKRTALLKPDSTRPDSAGSQPEASADTIRAIQRELNQRGFGPLPSDGVMGPVTRAAIMSYEHDNHLPITGEGGEALLARLLLGEPATDAPAAAGEVQSAHTEALIKQVQRMLAAAGYRPGPADGRLRPETTAAIRAFEQDQGLAAKGRVSAEVVTRLQSGAARLKAAEAR